MRRPAFVLRMISADVRRAAIHDNVFEVRPALQRDRANRLFPDPPDYSWAHRADPRRRAAQRRRPPRFTASRSGPAAAEAKQSGLDSAWIRALLYSLADQISRAPAKRRRRQQDHSMTNNSSSAAAPAALTEMPMRQLRGPEEEFDLVRAGVNRSHEIAVRADDRNSPAIRSTPAIPSGSSPKAPVTGGIEHRS